MTKFAKPETRSNMWFITQGQLLHSQWLDFVPIRALSIFYRS